MLHQDVEADGSQSKVSTSVGKICNTSEEVVSTEEVSPELFEAEDDRGNDANTYAKDHREILEMTNEQT